MGGVGHGTLYWCPHGVLCLTFCLVFHKCVCVCVMGTECGVEI